MSDDTIICEVCGLRANAASTVWTVGFHVRIEFPACWCCIALATEAVQAECPELASSDEFASVVQDRLDALSKTKEWLRK